METEGRKGGGVWLTSMVMWSNFMRLIPADGIPLRAVEANGRITNLGGLQRWGYISIEPADQTVRLKPGGRRAQEPRVRRNDSFAGRELHLAVRVRRLARLRRLER